MKKTLMLMLMLLAALTLFALGASAVMAAEFDACAHGCGTDTTTIGEYGQFTAQAAILCTENGPLPQCDPHLTTGSNAGVNTWGCSGATFIIEYYENAADGYVDASVVVTADYMGSQWYVGYAAISKELNGNVLSRSVWVAPEAQYCLTTYAY